MEFEILHEPDSNYFTLKVSGVYSYEENILALRQLIEHPCWQNGMNILYDLRQLSLEEIGPGNVRRVADIVKVLGGKFRPGRTALVADLVGRSKLAMYKYETSLSEDRDIQIFSPNDYGEAVNWVEGSEHL
jgi:hypothetical protein